MSRRLPFALAALLLALPPGAGAAQTMAGPFELAAAPIQLDPKEPARQRVGELTYAGGLQLTAKDQAWFGGFSGLEVADDGRFVSQSDAGDLMRGRLVLDAAGKLVGLADTTHAMLTDEAGLPPRSKSAADAEDITFLDGGGFAVSFEQDHRVMAYAGEGPGRRLAPPPDPDMGGNFGLEALAEWRDPSTGTLRLVEGAEDGRAWSCDLEGRDCRLFLTGADKPDKDYSLTGLDALPDGRGLIAVYRAYDMLRGMRGMICWVRPGEPAGKVTVLARLVSPLNLDNFEGVAAVSRPGGAVRIYVISDDNTSKLQRTLLMAFDWRPEPQGPTP